MHQLQYNKFEIRIIIQQFENGFQSKYRYCSIFFQLKNMFNTSTRSNKIQNLSLLHVWQQPVGTSDVNQRIKSHQQIYFCHPYSIVRKGQQLKSQQNLFKNRQMAINSSDKYLPNYQLFNFPIEQSQLDLSSDYYLSKPFKVMFQREVHPIMQTCCFRTNIDIEKYSQIQLKCQVQLMFCPNAVTEQAAIFKTIGKCDCKVRKLFDISTYLPIVFDQFQGVAIQGVYQAALIDFKYQKQPNQKNHTLNPENFHQYLKATTNGFNRVQVRNFYRYYRQLLQKQLFTIQQRHYDLLRVLGINSSMDQFRILKININSKIQNMIDHLGGYNSHQNPYNKRSLQNRNSQAFTSYSQQGGYNSRGMASFKSSQFSMDNSLSSEAYKQQISEQIIYDFLAIKAHIYKKWSDYLEFTTKHITAMAEKYKNNYNAHVKQRLSGNVFSHKVNSFQWKNSAYQDSGRQHLKLAEADRKKIQKDQQLWKQTFLVQNQSFFAKDQKNIKIFQQIYTISPKMNNTKSQKLLLRKSLDKGANLINLYSQNLTKRSLNSQQMQMSFDFKNNERKNSMPQNLNGFQIHLQQQLFQNRQITKSNASNLSNQYNDEDHFIILVHGFQASRQDFIVLKNCLQIRFKTKVFISTCNQGRTDDDIQTQGKRLALELQRYLNDSTPSLNYKLSFIGHSMGGIVIRTALCYLQNVSDHLYSYISFSTPHLGYLYQPSTHIQAGLWLMGALQKTSSIQQICLRQKQDLRQSFLYRLSRSRSLDKFKNLALVGSSQDKYVPYESARIQQNQQIIQQNLSTQNGQIIHQMIDGIIGTIQCKNMSRIDVIFNIQENNFDSMIGRTAHIRYLSDRQFIKVFCIVFDKFFK